MASVTPPAPLATAAVERRISFELAAHPGSAAKARKLTRAQLSGWRVSTDTCDAADLVVSELVTNAIVHTSSKQVVCEVRELPGDTGKLRIAVRDEGCGTTGFRPSQSAPADEHGRGLLLVAAVSTAWGAQETETGTGLVVWAELSRESGSGT